jgi:hypothetical protein
MVKATSKNIAPTSVPEVEITGNRYCRASRWILELGADVDADLLAHKAGISSSASRYCIEAHNGVVQALREAGLLRAEPKQEAVLERETKEPEPTK